MLVKVMPDGGMILRVEECMDASYEELDAMKHNVVMFWLATQELGDGDLRKGSLQFFVSVDGCFSRWW